MTDEQRDHLAELKTFAWAAPLIIPLIQRRTQTALETLLSEFRQGKTDNLARVAELNAFFSLERELRQKQQEHIILEEQHAKRNQK